MLLQVVLLQTESNSIVATVVPEEHGSNMGKPMLICMCTCHDSMQRLRHDVDLSGLTAAFALVFSGLCMVKLMPYRCVCW
jgi:hypothetical protein